MISHGLLAAWLSLALAYTLPQPGEYVYTWYQPVKKSPFWGGKLEADTRIEDRIQGEEEGSTMRQPSLVSINPHWLFRGVKKYDTWARRMKKRGEEVSVVKK